MQNRKYVFGIAVLLLIASLFGMSHDNHSENMQWEYGLYSTVQLSNNRTYHWMVGISDDRVDFVEPDESAPGYQYAKHKTFVEYLKSEVVEFRQFAAPVWISSFTPPEEIAKITDNAGEINLIGRLGWELFDIDRSRRDSPVYWFKRPRN